MAIYEVLKALTLSVEAGSQVIVSEYQYELAKGYLKEVLSKSEPALEPKSELVPESEPEPAPEQESRPEQEPVPETEFVPSNDVTDRASDTLVGDKKFADMSKPELLELVKEKGLPVSSGMVKTQLIALLEGKVV